MLQHSDDDAQLADVDGLQQEAVEASADAEEKLTADPMEDPADAEKLPQESVEAADDAEKLPAEPTDASKDKEELADAVQSLHEQHLENMGAAESEAQVCEAG